MYPVGILFGLGFDTATEVGLLAITAAAATGHAGGGGHGLPFGAIIALPLLFAAGHVAHGHHRRGGHGQGLRLGLQEPAAQGVLQPGDGHASASFVAAGVGGIEFLQVISSHAGPPRRRSGAGSAASTSRCSATTSSAPSSCCGSARCSATSSRASSRRHADGLTGPGGPRGPGSRTRRRGGRDRTGVTATRAGMGRTRPRRLRPAVGPAADLAGGCASWDGSFPTVGSAATALDLAGHRARRDRRRRLAARPSTAS